MPPLCKEPNGESSYTVDQPSGQGKSLTGTSLSAENSQGQYHDHQYFALKVWFACKYLKPTRTKLFTTAKLRLVYDRNDTLIGREI